MKKKWYTMLCLMLVLALPLAAFAEEEMDLMLEGVITEIVEGGFAIEDIEMGTVILNISEETQWEGITGADELMVGQYVMVDYSGAMTRSLPPQTHAERVRCYQLTGMVSELYDDGSFLLTGEPTHGEVVVHCGEVKTPVHLGMPVTVYFDGALAMSLPAQAAAKHIDVPYVSGTVSEFAESGFLLTDEEGKAYQVIMDENTLVGMLEEAEESEELPQEGTPEEPAEETEIEETLEWGNGDRVTVYYNGMLTRSEPAQLAALEIIVQR